MSIINNLKSAHASIALDIALRAANPDDDTLGKMSSEINKLAVEALTQGVESDEWKEYMRLFASNEAELTQLTDEALGNDPTKPWLKQSRAYIVSNSICDIGTTGRTHLNVDPKINIANDQPNEEFISGRKIKFPKLSKPVE